MLSAPIFETLNNEPTIQTSVFEAYNYMFSQELYTSSSEFLKNVTLTDYGNLYNTAVAFSNLALMYPAELNPLFERSLLIRFSTVSLLNRYMEIDCCVFCSHQIQ